MSVPSQGGRNASHHTWIDQADAVADVLKKLMFGFAIPGALLGVLVQRGFAIDDIKNAWQATASLGISGGALSALVYCISHQHSAARADDVEDVPASARARRRQAAKPRGERVDGDLREPAA